MTATATPGTATPGTTIPAQPDGTGPTLAETAPKVLSLIAGYVGHRTVAIGLRAGLLRALADRPGSTADDLAETCGLDPFYVSVWCRAAFAAGVTERQDAGYRLGDHMATLLLDSSSPAYAGGVFGVCEAPEMFGRFEEAFASGERMWWDDTSPEWIAAVSGTGTPFYTRLIPGGLDRIPGVAEALAAGTRVVDTACGAGVGLVRLAAAYPGSTVVGVDGDRHSIDRARARVEEAGLTDRVELVHSALEDMDLDVPAGVVINNISMHECRDIDRVTENVKAALEPGGWFVISDFPFPDTDETLRSVPGRIMTGIQFFEAQIDDQLLPRAAYDDLLARHGFTDIGSVQLTPMHALTYGRRPQE
jgi:SAM-dependent methyltransferase